MSLPFYPGGTTQPGSWDGSAISTAPVAGAGGYKFVVNGQPVGIVIGIGPYEPDTMYTTVTHGYFFTGSKLYIIEQGNIVSGTGQTADEFHEYAVLREGYTVRYHDLTTGAVLRTSTLQSIGHMFLDVSMYAVGDSLLYSEAIQPLGGGEAEGLLYPLFGSEAHGANMSMLAPLSGEGNIGVDGFSFAIGYLRHLTGHGGHSSAEGLIQPIIGSGLIGGTPPIEASYAMGVILPIAGYGLVGYPGGDAEAVLRELWAYAGDEAVYGYGELLPLTGDVDIGIEHINYIDVTLPAVSMAAEIVSIEGDIEFDYQIAHTSVLRFAGELITSEQIARVQHVVQRVSDSLIVDDMRRMLQILTFEGELVTEDTIAALRNDIVTIISELVLEPNIDTVWTSILSYVAEVTLSDVMGMAFKASIIDPIELEEEQEHKLIALASVLEDLYYEDTLSMSGMFRLSVSDTMVVEEIISRQLSEILRFTDDIVMQIMFSDGQATYTGWVMNTKTAAVTEYDRYKFNSLVYSPLGPLGFNDEGIFLLEGKFDDGEYINARMRTGLMNAGTNSEKMLCNAYIGVFNDGELRLKIVRGDDTFVYGLVAPTNKSGESMAMRRFDLGNAMVHVYFQLEFMNTDGAYFDLNAMDVYYVELNRSV